MGVARRVGGVARVHADVLLRGELADHRRAGRGTRADRGRRPALPRRDLVAVGHDARPPRRRARRRAARPDRPGGPHHAARQRQPHDHRAGRGARAPPAGRPGRTSCSRRTARRRSSRRSRWPSSTGPTWPPQPARTRGPPDARPTWPSATPITATRSARSRSAPAGSAPTCSTRCASRCCGRRATTTPTGPTSPIALIDEHHERLAALVIEPLVQGAAGMLVTDPRSVRRVVEAAQARGVLVIADEVATGFGRTGTLFACEQCGVQPRPARHRQGPDRRLPARCRPPPPADASTTPSSGPT